MYVDVGYSSEATIRRSFSSTAIFGGGAVHLSPSFPGCRSVWVYLLLRRGYVSMGDGRKDATFVGGVRT